MVMNKYSTVLPRIGAHIIDGLIFLPFSFIEFDSSKSPMAFLGLELLYVITWTIYTVALHVKHGQTLGKMLFNIRLYNIDEKSLLTPPKAFLRESIWVAAQTVIIFYYFFLFISERWSDETMDAYQSEGGMVSLIWIFIDAVTTLFNSKRRSFQDYIGGSVVVRTV